MKKRKITIPVFEYDFEIYYLRTDDDIEKFKKEFDDIICEDQLDSACAVTYQEPTMIVFIRCFSISTIVHETNHLSKYFCYDHNIQDENFEVEAYIQGYMFEKIMKLRDKWIK